VQLTLVQRLAMDGAVIVSTPQRLAIADVHRGIRMFRDTQVPILGVIENMSVMRRADTTFAPFGEGTVRNVAIETGAPFVGSLALDPTISQYSDAGSPIALDPQQESARWFHETAAAIERIVSTSTPKRPPEIIFTG